MKTKILVLLIVVAMVFTMAVAPNLKLSRFTVINKSGGPIAIRLTPATHESQATYFLNIAYGDKEFPETAVFTVQENEYKLTTYFYKETVVDGYVVSEPICTLWDYPNLEYIAPTVDLTRNNHVVILSCTQIAEPKSFGEHAFWKYWYPGYIKVNYVY